MLLQINTNAKKLLQNKEHVTDGIGQEAFLYIILILSFAFLVFSLTASMILVWRRWYYTKQDKLNKGLITKYQDYLAQFISMPIESELMGISINDKATFSLSKKDISSRSRRELLSNEMYKMHRELEGHHSDMIRQLYLGFYMQEDTLRKLKSKSWSENVRGIDEARQLELTAYLPYIEKHLQHKNIDVRCQAINAVISLNKGSIKVLSQIGYKLTDWEKHKILHTLESFESFKDWDFPIMKLEYPIHKQFIEELEVILNPQPVHYSEMLELVNIANG